MGAKGIMSEKANIEPRTSAAVRRHVSNAGKRCWTPPEIVFLKDASESEIAGGMADDGGLLFMSVP